ncbi:NACHT domain-containing NTPase [Roseivirga sp. E12]|uniref:NACHT domain-containing protein n=1 Tax=Roseivirga sp. E12 TaxID=2819237 RepID=UPI001ABC946A|nr:hypothetical protein [Roseivirga sp. E12]MBO3698266.1 hypothetical protein [Roseivirga sp. E12]
MSLLSTFLSKLGISLLVTYIKNYISKIDLRSLSSRSSKKYYFRKTKEEINRMPFIYLGIDSDVLDDFVNIESVKIDIDTFQPKPSDTAHDLKYLIKNKEKLLFLGNAGIGKTTFFRFATLNIIDNKRHPLFQPLQDELPILIPLKILENRNPSPILSYILKEIHYFKPEVVSQGGSIEKKPSDYGIKKLTELAKYKNIFLLLDGYDEIDRVEKDGFLQTELTALMSSVIEQSDATNKKLNSQFIIIYQELSRCRVWLSSREQFYDINKLDLNLVPYDPDYNLRLGQVFEAIMLRGLETEQRINLVSKIFKRYTGDRSFQQGHLLDPYFFMEEIDLIDDSELKSFSRRPLFLTVMAYLYVNKVASERKLITGESFISVIELIESCLRLLLEDNDDLKVRNIKSDSFKIRFKRRRSLYQKEKFGFLVFLSYHIVLNSKTVFTKEFLRQIAIKYISNTSFENKDEILKGLSKNERSLSNLIIPDMVEQIIYSGVFVFAGKKDGKSEYDFPHRLFREVLALKALDNEENLSELESNIENGSLSEFLLFAFKNKPAIRQRLVSRIIKKIRQGESVSYLSNLLNTLNNSYYDYESSTSMITEKYLKFVFESIQNNERVELSVKILKRVKIDESHESLLITLLKEKLNKPKSNKIGIQTTIAVANTCQLYSVREICFKYLTTNLYVSNKSAGTLCILHLLNVQENKSISRLITAKGIGINALLELIPYFEAKPLTTVIEELEMHILKSFTYQHFLVLQSQLSFNKGLLYKESEKKSEGQGLSALLWRMGEENIQKNFEKLLEAHSKIEEKTVDLVFNGGIQQTNNISRHPVKRIKTDIKLMLADIAKTEGLLEKIQKRNEGVGSSDERSNLDWQIKEYNEKIKAWESDLEMAESLCQRSKLLTKLDREALLRISQGGSGKIEYNRVLID